MLGLDYSAGRPTGAQVKAAGFGFVVRYLPKLGDSWVAVLTQAEFQDLHSAGVDVGLVYESTQPDRMLQGTGAGNQDATHSLAQARAITGMEPACIYFACDFDAQPNHMSALDGYLRAAGKVLGPERVGVYGGIRTINYLRTSGAARWLWQTAAWSAGDTAAGIHLYQRIGTVQVGGVGCDVNEAKTANFGQMVRHAVTIQPQSEEDEMLLIYGTPATSPYLLSGGILSLVVDPSSVAQLEAAGIKRVILTARDMATMVTRYGR